MIVPTSVIELQLTMYLGRYLGSIQLPHHSFFVHRVSCGAADSTVFCTEITVSSYDGPGQLFSPVMSGRLLPMRRRALHREAFRHCSLLAPGRRLRSSWEWALGKWGMLSAS